jgi:hypothetical protein
MNISLSAILAQKHSRTSRMNLFVPEMILEQPFLIHLLLLEGTDIESNVRFHFHCVFKTQFFGRYKKHLFLISKTPSFPAYFVCPFEELSIMVRNYKCFQEDVDVF